MNRNKKSGYKTLILIVLILLVAALLGLFWYRYLKGKRAQPGTGIASRQATLRGERVDTAGIDDSLALAGESTEVATDAEGRERSSSRQPKTTQAAAGSLARTRLPAVGRAQQVQSEDTTEQGPDRTMHTSPAVPLDTCRFDTLAPWVYPDPSGGLHRTVPRVSLIANEPCSIYVRVLPDSTWRYYTGPLRIPRTATIAYYAVDECGNRSTERRKTYEIQPAPTLSACPEDMAHVTVGQASFCIDQYEWPNRKGTTPSAFVSLYQAMDSCFAVGKRLCSSTEWMLACAGPYTWEYPYGTAYVPMACVTHDSSSRASGSRPECRGYFKVYDMSGNLAEWTSTRSGQNRDFYNVAGGFWESGPRATCSGMRYSYFPQNRHNPVGFRCCRDPREATP